MTTQKTILDIKKVFYLVIILSLCLLVQRAAIAEPTLGASFTKYQGKYFYYPDPSIADQGAAVGASSVKDFVDEIGSKEATIVFSRKDSGNTTTYTFSTSETIPSNIAVEVENGAILSDNGGTASLTINGNFKAGLYKVFDWTGSGSVSFGSGAVSEVYPEWWGVDGTADEVQISMAISACPNTAKVMLTQNYTTTAAITISSAIELDFIGEASIKANHTGNAITIGTNPDYEGTSVSDAAVNQIKFSGASFTVDEHIGKWVYLYDTSYPQYRKIVDNTSDTVVLDYDLDAAPTGQEAKIYPVIDKVVLKNPTIDGLAKAHNGIEIIFADRVIIKNIDIDNCTHNNLEFLHCNNVNVDGGKTLNSDEIGIFCYNSENVNIKSVYAEGNDHSYSLQMKDCRNGRFDKCTVKGIAGIGNTGINLKSSGRNVCFNVGIENCTIFDMPNIAISIQAFDSEGSSFDMESVSLVGNTMKNCGLKIQESATRHIQSISSSGNAIYGAGINIDTVNGLSLTGVTVVKCSRAMTVSDAIGFRFHNNTIINPMYNVAANTVIRIEDAEDCVFDNNLILVNDALCTGNVIWEEKSGYTQKRNLFINNVYIDSINTATEYSLRGTGTSRVVTPKSQIGGHGRTKVYGVWGELVGSASIEGDTSTTIPLSIPSGAKLLGVSLRVDEALAAGETWDAAYSGGLTQTIATNVAVDKNTKVNTSYDANANSDVASSVTNINITRNGGGSFTAQGKITAKVHFYFPIGLADL